MSTFSYVAEGGAAETKQPRVRAAIFGDGYQQRVGDGINTKPRSWSLKFIRESSALDPIEAFLDATNGTASFDWTPPKGAAGKWICKTWQRSVRATTIQELTATFEEVFGE